MRKIMRSIRLSILAIRINGLAPAHFNPANDTVELRRMRERLIGKYESIVGKEQL